MTSTMLAVGVEEGTKKIRKPYTITKSRESWTEQEHDKFLEALQLFDRDWKKIEAFIGSKTVIQIRSHAQKYFLKVQKNGTGEHVPPPRPKRKSAQPYPQKASKLLLPDAITSNVIGKTGSSSDGSSIDVWPQESHSSSQLNPDYHLEATPDFAQIYKFIGSIFDPGVTGHLKRSREMAPIDRETIILLMRNLSINLSSPEFDEEKLFLPVYEMNAIEKQTTVTPNSDEKVGLS